MSEENVRREGSIPEETGEHTGASAQDRTYFDYTGYPGEEMTRRAAERNTGEWNPIPPDVPPVPVKKKKGFLRKTMTAVCVGLLFGIFAGLGFYGVHAGMKYFGVELFKETTTEQPVSQNGSQVVSQTRAI